MSRLLRQQAGTSLVEVLLSVAVLVLAVVAIVSALMLGERSKQSAQNWSEPSQQIRLAMNMMAQDFGFARWDSMAMPVLNGVEIMVFQPATVRDGFDPCPPGADWTGFDEWPGDLCEWKKLSVRYYLVGDSLVRETSWFDGLSTHVFATQTLVNNLAGTSFIETEESPAGGGLLIRVRLQKAAQGVSRLAEGYSEFHIR